MTAMWIFFVERNKSTPSFIPNTNYSNNTDSLVAFYQCYNHYRATEEVLARFRYWYPTQRLALFNDGGEKAMLLLAHRYYAEYQYAKRSSDAAGLYFSSANAGVRFIERVLSVVGDEDWLLLLEDDVWVTGCAPLDTLQYTVNGNGGGVWTLDKGLVRGLHAVGVYPSDLHYGACGGAMISGGFLRVLKSSDWQMQVQYMFGYKTRIASDELISSLVYLNGGSIGAAPAMEQVIQHGHKEYY